MVVILMREGGEKIWKGKGMADITWASDGAWIEVEGKRFPKGAVAMVFTIEVGNEGLMFDYFMPEDRGPNDFAFL